MRLEITPEEREELRKKRIKNVTETTMEFQLGCYVAEEIIRKDLPCLNVDMIHTNKVINVTTEEFAETQRLNKVWYDNYDDKLNRGESADWLAVRAYHKELEDKYLPKVLTSYINPINVVDMEEFKKGIRNGLWHSDICHYNIAENSDIDVKYDDDYYFTIITLKR